MSWEGLRARLVIERSAEQLQSYLAASMHLMQVLALACGHSRFDQFVLDDLTTWYPDVAYLSGVPYGGVVAL